MKKILLFLAFIQYAIMAAQSQKNDLAFNLRATSLPIFDEYRLGAEASLYYYFTNEVSVGTKFQYTFNNYDHGFIYETPKAIVHYLNISTPIQYDVVNSEKFQLGFGIAPGVSFATLRDRTQLKDEEYYDEDSGVTTIVKTPMRLNRDAYFTLTPNLNVVYKLFDVEKESNTALYLSGNAGYQFAFGNGDFTKNIDIRNYVISLGFTIKGTSN